MDMRQCRLQSLPSGQCNRNRESGRKEEEKGDQFLSS